jgi:hypothetical protein
LKKGKKSPKRRENRASVKIIEATMQEVHEKSLFNIDAESAIIGSFLIDPDAFPTYGATLAPERFYRDAHQLIHRAMLDMHARGEPADIVTLTDEIEQRGQLTAIGGADYITQLVNAVPTSANVECYVQRVIRLAQQRDERRALDEYIKDTYAGLPDALARHQRRLEAIEAYAGTSDDADDYFMDLDQILDESPRTWAIQDMVLDGTVNTWVGDTGTYKSTIALDVTLTAALAGCGESAPMCLGNVVQGGHAIYIAAEGQRGIPARVRGWLNHYKVSAEDRARVKHHFHLKRSAVPLFQQSNIDELLRQARRSIPEGETLAWVFVDTLNMSLGGANENLPTDMAIVYGGLIRVKEETGAQIVVIHHEGKDGGIRGTTVIPDNNDGIIVLKKKDGGVLVTCFKQRDADLFQPFTFSVNKIHATEDAASPIILCVPTRCDGSQATSQAKRPKGMSLRMLDTLAALGSASYSEWRKASGVKDSTFDGIMTDRTLLDNGWVIHSEEKELYSITNEGMKYATLNHPETTLKTENSGLNTYPDLPSTPYKGGGIQGNQGDSVPMAAHAQGNGSAPHPQPDTLEPAQGDLRELHATITPDEEMHTCTYCGAQVAHYADIAHGWCVRCAINGACIKSDGSCVGKAWHPFGKGYICDKHHEEVMQAIEAQAKPPRKKK